MPGQAGQCQPHKPPNPTSPPRNRHPAQPKAPPRAVVIPASRRHPREPSSSPRAVVIPASRRHPREPSSSPRTRGSRRADKREGRTTVRHSGKTQLNVRPQGQANICHCPPNQSHPRRTNVIPAHAGNQKGGQTGRATKRRSRKSTGTHQRFNRFSVHPRVFAVFLFMHDCYVFATTSQQCD